MSDRRYNLLTQPLIQAPPDGHRTLPGLLAALARDAVESYPALRPHQRPAWHMLLVQLAALALRRGGATDIPENEDAWRDALRSLIPDFPDDEPWCLAVADETKPAFLQPPVPPGLTLGTQIPSPDALDLLITSRNHDLKQAVARDAAPEDWLFALVSLQTGEGYGGAGNQGVARMNGGASSRALLGLAPRPAGNARGIGGRPGAHFRRDLSVLIEARAAQMESYDDLGYPAQGGLGLTWLAPWPEGAQLELKQLDIWFIEICRRIRLCAAEDGVLWARKGVSKATRINAKHLSGYLGDPWAPVHKTDAKSFTLSERDFDYRTLTNLLLSGDWELPLLARPASFETDRDGLVLIAEALSRGNSKTDGFKSRVLPVGGRVARALSLGPQRQALNEIAKQQMKEIEVFDKALSGALALAAARGDREARKKEHYALATDARTRLDRAADGIFFDHLWARFEAQDKGEKAVAEAKDEFRHKLFARAGAIFKAALPALPCASIFRPRAEARATSAFHAAICKVYPELFSKEDLEETGHAVA